MADSADSADAGTNHRPLTLDDEMRAMVDADEVETTTYSIEGPDGDSDELELPPGLIDLLREEDETRETVVGDMALVSFVQQAHAAVHHTQGEPDEEVVAIEEKARDLFEERLGISFEQATGHSH